MKVARRLGEVVLSRSLVKDPLQEELAVILQRVYDSHVQFNSDPQGALRMPSWLTFTPPVKGIYIWGGVGVGKSMIMDILHGIAMEEGKVSTRRAHYHEFMLDIHRRCHVQRMLREEGTNRHRVNDGSAAFVDVPEKLARLRGARENNKLLRQMGLVSVDDPLWKIGHELSAETSLLCLDEFQVTDVADAMILKRLFEGVWAGGGTLVATSNRPPDSLYEKGLNRDQFLPFVAELKRKCDIHQLQSTEGRDYRLRNIPIKHAQDAAAFFHVLGTDVEGARLTFVEKFKKACGGTAKVYKNVLLDVSHGRTLAVPFCNVRPHDIARTMRGGVAMISFDELCGDRAAQGCSPAGAVDMIAIAEKFSTLYLTDMPKLALSVSTDGAGKTNPNHARRFVLLLDAMYEQKNRLVISTFADTIEELFAFGENKTEEVKELSMTVSDEGGSSGRLTTMIGEMEWSATGLQNASLALAAGAGKLETAFALERAYSRLKEMQTEEYRKDDAQ